MNDRIVYSSPFVPVELIAALGLRPFRVGPIAPEPSSTSASMGMCSYAAMLRSFACSAQAGGIILASTCDQMRRAAEAIASDCAVPTFLLHVPATWQTPSALLSLYREDLERLCRWLTSLGGLPLSPIALLEAMSRYDEHRRALRAARLTLSARQYAQAIAHLFRAGDLPALAHSRPPHAKAPIAIVGGPMRIADLHLLDIIESAGGHVALDAMETGERGMVGGFDAQAMNDDPLAELARAYFTTIPDAFRRPNTLLYSYLRDEIAARDVRGVILIRRVWCDLWHAEFGRLRDELSVPVIEVDLEEGDGGLERNRTRIESLLEIVR